MSHVKFGDESPRTDREEDEWRMFFLESAAGRHATRLDQFHWRQQTADIIRPKWCEHNSCSVWPNDWNCWNVWNDWNSSISYPLIPNSLFTARCRVKSKIRLGATVSLSFRACASSVRNSLISSSVGTPLDVNAGLQRRYHSVAVARSLFQIRAKISAVSFSFSWKNRVAFAFTRSKRRNQSGCSCSV